MAQYSIEAIENFDVLPLVNGQDHGRRSSVDWVDHFGVTQAQIAGSGWEGASFETAIQNATSDHMRAQEAAAHAMAYLPLMSGHVTALSNQKQSVLIVRDAAQAAQFDVSDSGGISDRLPPNPATREERQAMAEGFRDTLAQEMKTFHMLDRAAGATARAHAATLRASQFPASSGGAQAMSNGPHGDGFAQDPLISNPKEPDKPNPIVGPAPTPAPPDTKNKSGPRQAFDGMLEVAGGALLDLGSTAALVPEILAEVPTGGLDTPLTAASIGGLLTGAGMVEDGLDDLNHIGVTDHGK